jgi:hypothetical protein
MEAPGLAPDPTVTKYLDLYGQDLPAQGIDAMRAAACLGNKNLAKALLAMAAEVMLAT